MLPKLEAAVEESLRRAGPSGCVVWATIARPPVNGHTYAQVNTYLRGMAVLHPQTMRLVEWERWVAAHPRLMNPKYPVHPKVRGGLLGRKVRARMFAAGSAPADRQDRPVPTLATGRPV